MIPAPLPTRGEGNKENISQLTKKAYIHPQSLAVFTSVLQISSDCFENRVKEYPDTYGSKLTLPVFH